MSKSNFENYLFLFSTPNDTDEWFELASIYPALAALSMNCPNGDGAKYLLNRFQFEAELERVNSKTRA